MDESSKKMRIIAHTNCRLCGKDQLKQILSLGEHYVINFLERPDQEKIKAPYDLVLCDKDDGGCGLLQLKHTVSSELLYRKFWYKSGVNQSMIDALSDITKNAEDRIDLKSNDIVIDIGANDGTLLRQYKTKDLTLVGFEPARNLIDEAKVGTTKIINDFFSFDNYDKEFPNKKAKIITSISMFYDLEDPNSFVKDIAKCLDSDGIWINQMNYLTTMLENNAFDNIVHEHLEYYSLSSLNTLLEMHGLEVFDVEINGLNGGSFRTYIKHKDSKKFNVSADVKDLETDEKKKNIDKITTYQDFSDRIEKLKNETVDFIKKQVSSGKKIYVYGASTRGTTLLQYYGLNNNLIKAAADRNPNKWGKEIIGTNIPIISEEQARKDKPDYFLVLPWYFLDEFKIRENEYLASGGKFIVPLPYLQIIS